MTSPKTIYLIDGSAYIYRSFHALPPLSNSRGLPTHAVLGFTGILVKLIKDKKPSHLAMFFDSRGPSFRHELYPDYKANRPPMPDDLAVQLPFVRDITDGFRVKRYEKPGFEADDLIGTAAVRAAEQGFTVIVVSGDKDFMQLVSDRILIFDPVKEQMIDRRAVREKTGVDPEQILDVMALTGDTSDNVPGVPGIGKKTAPALIETYGSLEGLYDNLDRITAKKQKENLAANRDLAFLSRKLVTIDTAADMDFSVEDCRAADPDTDRLSDLFAELEFKKFQQEFPKRRVQADTVYRAILTPGDLDRLVADLAAESMITLDTETTSTDPMRAKLVGLSFSIRPHEAVYIPCGHNYEGAPAQLALTAVLDALRPVLENPCIGKTGQNIKYDMIVLARHGIEVAGVSFDTMVASYVLNPTLRSHGLDQIALTRLDHKTISFEDVAGKGRSMLLFSEVPLDKAVPYACEDADITRQIACLFSEELDRTGLRALFDTVEMPLCRVLYRMEMNGIRVNRDRLESLSHTFEQEILTLEQEIYTLAGEPFNIKSSQQLGQILFEKLGLPVQKKTKKKTGYSTDVDVLTILADRHDLPARVLRYRTLSKLKSTYTDALIEMIHPETGRIHTSFNQTVTVTGRLSSSDPNLQNIPIRTEEGRLIRSAFVPEPGHVLVSADYSQIELRILAHCSEDPILIEAFVCDQDIHTRTAAEVFDYHPSLVTAELRRQAKAINFGIVYGMSPYGLSRELNISQKMAKTYIDHYFNRYQGVKRYMDRAVEEARATGRTSTLLGRIRDLPEITSSNVPVRQFAERSAINTPIQGTAADLIKLAMIRCQERIDEEHLPARMLLSVHDEIVFEVDETRCDAVMEQIREVMEHIWELRVPLKVNIARGDNWAEAH
ncbi:DNA polymerase I [Desulfatiferula olefinivorans]